MEPSQGDSGRVESGLGVELSGVESTVNSSRGVESSRWSTVDSSRFELSHGVEWSGVGWGGVVWCLVRTGRVELSPIERSRVEWSRVESIQVESSQGVELSRVDSRFLVESILVG